MAPEHSDICPNAIALDEESQGPVCDSNLLRIVLCLVSPRDLLRAQARAHFMTASGRFVPSAVQLIRRQQCPYFFACLHSVTDSSGRLSASNGKRLHETRRLVLRGFRHAGDSPGVRECTFTGVRECTQEQQRPHCHNEVAVVVAGCVLVAVSV